MIIRAPARGTVSWQGDQLWLAVADHCSLIRVSVPACWSWRRDLELDFVEAGAPLVLEGNDPTEWEECRASARQALTLAERELVEQQARSALARVLLEPTRLRLLRVRARLDAEG